MKADISNQKIFDKWLKPLSDAYGASGFEHEVAELTMQLADEYGSVHKDLMQNVYVARSGNFDNQERRIKVQLDAHIDEVGFMVQAILANGTLAVVPLGGWVTHNIPAHTWVVRNTKGQWITAISASKPPHFMTALEKNQSLAMDSIVLDVGASSKEQAISEFSLGIGLPVVPRVFAEYDKEHDLVIGKAFDCRIGCSALLMTLDLLKKSNLNCDIEASFSTQEEVGLRGVRVTAKQIQPDLAIVFEGTPADDTFTPHDRMQTAIGQGPMLRYVDSSMIANPAWQNYALRIAKSKKIPCQAGVRSGGGTNGGFLHLNEQGVPTIVIGVPVRYIHTHYGIAKVEDLKNTSLLGKAIIESIDNNILQELAAYHI